MVMAKMFRRVARAVLPTRRGEAHADFDPAFWPHYEACKRYTMTSVERMYALYEATRYVVRGKIPGDFAECGVWRGGSIMLAARVLRELGDSSRKVYLYDTFEGMSAPTTKDVDLAGRSAGEKWSAKRAADHNDWCYAPLADVQRNIAATGYPTESVVFVKGTVEDTLPGTAPERIALLRLDTDWYESTRQTLVHLYPRLAPGGVLIIDDYGHWQGCRQAVDEYFAANEPAPLLTRVDYTGRIAVRR
jgi:O-methyltransferase